MIDEYCSQIIYRAIAIRQTVRPSVRTSMSYVRLIYIREVSTNGYSYSYCLITVKFKEV